MTFIKLAGRRFRLSVASGVTAGVLLLLNGAPVCRAQAPAGPERKGLLNVAIYPDSVSPKEVSVRGRVFLLRVANHVGIGEIQFELLREAGARLKQVKLPRGRSKVIEEVVLEPGTYILQVPGRPAWTSRIRVSPASN